MGHDEMREAINDITALMQLIDQDREEQKQREFIGEISNVDTAVSNNYIRICICLHLDDRENIVKFQNAFFNFYYNEGMSMVVEKSRPEKILQTVWRVYLPETYTYGVDDRMFLRNRITDGTIYGKMSEDDKCRWIRG